MNCTYYQCINEACKFRFPWYERITDDFKCPSCKSPVAIISSVDLHVDPGSMGEKYSYFPLEALFDNIRSALNVGSMFRTADGFGIRHLYLCGMTPTPEIKNVAKTSLGAEKYIEWTYAKNSVEQLYKLKQLKYLIVSIEEHRNAESIYSIDQFSLGNRVVLVVGNEKCGIDPEILEISDRIFYIPMTGIKKSLNVAVAFGIAVSTLQIGLIRQLNSQDFS